MSEVIEPTKEEWAKLCRTFTQHKMICEVGIGKKRQKTLSNKYGIAPYQACRRGHLGPREDFTSVKSRLCKACEGEPYVTLYDNKREEFLFAQDKELSKTKLWLATPLKLSYYTQEHEYA